MTDDQQPLAPDSRQVVFTNKARCRDCYRCVRVCPVKAIRMDRGQASVQAERCIACGTCIRECPQSAKSFRNDLTHALELVASGAPVAASLAPSFAAVFSEWERRRVPSALRQLGFRHVSETAIGAYHVAHRTAELVREEPGAAHIGTACPAAVSYVEQYRPDLVERLVPVCSPMLAHARHLKRTLGPETRVIFIGPCVAKKAEAERPEHAGLVDCVLTFAELLEWFKRADLSLQECEESDFDEQPEGEARFFPLEGGSFRTAALDADLLAMDNVTASGFEEVQEALDNLTATPRGLLLEPLFCPQGCVGGPALARPGNLFDRRRQVLEYAASHTGREPGAQPADLSAAFAARQEAGSRQFREDEIRRVLEHTGKTQPEDELNCGACGYPTCRDKAVAVLQGMAELEMCIPYMRRLAEQRTDRIIETSPNGIVILDDRLNILHMNPAFRKMFMCTDSVLGKRISYLMDPDQFERLAAGGEDKLEATVHHPNYRLVCHQVLYPLRDENQYVGIFVNITRSQEDRERLDQLRVQTIAQAQELLEHQISMAQQIAQALGDSAAKGEKLVSNLVQMVGDEQEPPEGRERGWLGDTYTSR